ncbi:MAG TPA: peptide-methionine (R)-S-oxide reductase MsrB [Steroidobacteraceae bacterium]|jgi:peptide-methionine (R)-S-oxide reductase|nr:peptide-methionine (R)-S-oxide reductase MsrB [Steroidobacteraceae bacterium]
MTSEKFAVEKSDTEWRSLLDADQFRVLREHGTERAGTSPLNYEKRTGVYHCAACSQPLFESSTKYESGSGWPSFFRPLPNAVATSTDSSHGMTRVEVHCRNCGGHLGHVFNDGPRPTGQRYCMNGTSLKFEPGIGPDSAKSAGPL